MRNYDRLFKIVLIGDSNVGKSCMLLRFADDAFTETYVSTIGVDFRSKYLELGDKSVKLQIWDTAGQERYRTITSAYYRGAHAVMMVYDVTNLDSFKSVERWMTEVRHASPESTAILVGNKMDLPRVVSTEAGRELAARLDVPHREVSAKTGDGVSAIFEDIAELLLLENTVIEEIAATKSLYPPKRGSRCCMK